MERFKTINKVHAGPDHFLKIHWADGTVASIDMAKLSRKLVSGSLQNLSVFKNARVGDWGHSVYWPDGTELGADRLWRMTLLSQGKNTVVDFLDWRMQHGLSLTATAAALGISRRMVAYYSSGERDIPRTVILACKGWEAEIA